MLEQKEKKKKKWYMDSHIGYFSCSYKAEKLSPAGMGFCLDLHTCYMCDICCGSCRAFIDTKTCIKPQIRSLEALQRSSNVLRRMQYARIIRCRSLASV